ncbi:Hypothetical protein POVR1_LOCUS151 [uncultured virus]|nr:Hypothetical protein POVR1_LOCUS151 [uncultured virus]
MGIKPTKPKKAGVGLAVSAVPTPVHPQVTFNFDTTYATASEWEVITPTRTILTHDNKKNTMIDNLSPASIVVYPSRDPSAAYTIGPKTHREIIGLKDIATRNGNKINYRELDSNNTMCCVDEFKFYLSVVDVFTTRVLVTT